MIERIMRWLLPGLLLAAAVVAEEREVLLVVHSGDGSVVFVDPVSGEPQATVRVGIGPHEIAVSADGKRAVVANYGHRQGGSTLSVVDIERQRLQRTITLSMDEIQGGQRVKRDFRRPHGVCFTKDPNLVLVTCESEKVLLIVDLEEGRVVDAIDTGQELSHMVLLSRDGRRAFVSNKLSGTISVVDLSRRRTVQVIATGGGAQGMALHPLKDELWVANVETNSISVIDTQALEEVAEFPCGSYPVRLAFTPDGSQVVCVNYQAGSLSIFDSDKRRLVSEVRLERVSEQLALERPMPAHRQGFGRTPLPVGLLISPDGARAWVTCTRSDQVAELDLATQKILRYIKAPTREPYGMGWSSFEDDVTSAK
jgi:YVTN family beta-propeller protein